jgi:HSP20 family protein
MDDFFGWSPMRGQHAYRWTPRVDVHEEPDQYVVEVDLPGLSKDDIDVTMENDVLTISGERKREQEKKDRDRVFRRERFCGQFTRSMSFPGDVDVDNIAGSFKDGVLTLTLPKSEATKPRKIDLK